MNHLSNNNATKLWLMYMYNFNLKQIVAVTLENYEVLQMNSENTKEDAQCSQPQDHWAQEALKVEENASSFPEIQKKAPLLRDMVHSKSESDTTTWDILNSCDLNSQSLFFTWFNLLPHLLVSTGTHPKALNTGLEFACKIWLH